MKCGSYTYEEIRSDAYFIVYNPPSTFEKIADDVIELAASFWNNVEYLKAGASRGYETPEDLIPQPGFDVTLISGQKVKFSWWSDSKGEIFSIKDDAGNKIFSKNISGLTPVKDSSLQKGKKDFAFEIEFEVKDLKLKEGKQYFWSIDDNSRRYKIKLLDKKTSNEILSRLNLIDSENISESARILKKSTYLQLISDTYSEKIDLYWLSAQWLLDFKFDILEEQKYQKKLLDKCVNHLNNEFRES